MKFFNFIFDRMLWWNKKAVIDYTPFFSAIIILAFFQGLNVIFLNDLIHYYLKFNFLFFQKSYFLPPIIFLFLNYFYYKSKKKQTRINQWVLSFKKKKLILFDILTILYFIISWLLLIWIGFKIRQQNF